ncbi:MAG: ankyrin repeat domain-containing protein [bacterium]
MFKRFASISLLVSLVLLAGCAEKSPFKRSNLQDLCKASPEEQANARSTIKKSQYNYAMDDFLNAWESPRKRETVALAFIKAGIMNETVTWTEADRKIEEATVLHIAIVENLPFVFGKSLACIDPDRQTKDGSTPLTLAVEFEHPDLAKKLIQAGASVNLEDSRGMTPLHWAAARGYRGMAEELIERGSNLQTRDRTGRTPLHHAAEQNQPELVKLLVNNGADPAATTKNGWRPLNLTTDPQIKEILRESLSG